MWMCRPSDLLGRIACVQSDGGLAPPGYRDVFCQRSEMTRLEILAAQQGALGIEVVGHVVGHQAARQLLEKRRCVEFYHQRQPIGRRELGRG